MSVLGNNILAGASGQGGYFIDRSLRFRSSASAYLSRTPASAGNRKTWTWSGWVKFGSLTATFPRLFSAGTDANNRTEILFITNTNQIRFLSTVTGTSRGLIDTVAYLRDPSAWYHLVVSLDASSTTLTVYINGVQQTLTTSTAIANVDHMVNSTNTHSIGRYFGAGSHFDGYMTEINFIDGQALDPTSFGEYNSDTGVWQPIKYTGTYGTNGFYLNFSDNSTTTTLGYDTSGNGNNWTANNISVTSGVTYDSMTDVPTLTSEDAANFATINPLSFVIAQSTVSNGNLAITTPIGSGGNYATFNFPTTGKWYAEYACTAGTYYFVGVQKPLDTNKYVYYYHDGRKYIDGVFTSYGAAYATNDVIGVAVNCDDNEITFYKNGVSQGAISYTLNTGDYAFGFIDGASSANVTYVINFGATPFAYTPPAGFKSLNTYNLPDSTIEDGSEYFNAVLYTGDSSYPRSITGVGFQPDFTWVKSRSKDYSHVLYDVVRGTGTTKSLISDSTGAEGASSTLTNLSSFDSDGFTIGSTSGTNILNTSPYTFVAWNWKANGSGVSNTDGIITSTVSANTTAGFSIVSWTNQGTNTDTVGHGLGVAPKIYISKKASTTGDWFVFYSFVDGSHDYLLLNSTQAAINNSIALPTSTVFTTGAGNTDSYITYCFAEVEGFSKFGSYVGNGSADGTFVYTGFRPAFVMIKRTDSAQAWYMYDGVRDEYNVCNQVLQANDSVAEATSANNPIDFLSNGFKCRGAGLTTNASGGTYIYMAFAENPFKNALAR